MVNVIWFRNDLRITDNPALDFATNGAKVRAVFIKTPGQWRQHGWGHNKIEFVMKCVEELRAQLQTLEIKLDILECDTFSDSITTILQYMSEHQAMDLFINLEYELNERIRDQMLSDSCTTSGIKLHKSHDQCLIPPGEILTKQGKPYTVFTPFKRACYAHLDRQRFTINRKTSSPARKILAEFCHNRIESYKIDRDFPSINGTSSLSPYLACGAISVRECYNSALSVTSTEQALPWIDELLWRDFYRNITYHFPDVCKGHNFNRKYDRLPWNKPGDALKKWQAGETGIPIIDAAQRQLVETGWMHNRLRMITAMFLSKNLLLDWRHGEEFFGQYLIDLDFASNNGGWQWSASTGTDAVPYFRIFNPLTQSAKFDPKAEFIRHFCPELKNVAIDQIHNPNPSSMLVDLKATRQRAIEVARIINTN